MQEQLQKKKAKKLAVEKEVARAVAKAKVKAEAKNLAVFLGLLAAAVGGRVALQAIPSVEPIIPLAVLAGLLFGAKEGFALGGSAYIISNFFVWGLQGPWTVLQALGGALAGGLAGLFGKTRKPSGKNLLVLAVAGTALYELIMNVGGGLMGIGLFMGLISLPVYFLMSLPFTLAHIVTNLGFAKLLQPLLKLRRKENDFQAMHVTRIDAGGRRTDVRLYKSAD